MDIESYLETKRKLYGFDFIALYDDKTGEVQLAGKGFEDVNREELTENDVFGQELREGHCASCMEEERMVYAVKTGSASEEKTLWAAASSEEITSIMMSKTFQEKSSTYVVDKTEQVLLSSGEEESMAFWNLVVGQKEDKEILENALKDYTGTVLYVSHDRYFINQTATRILELTGQTLVNYIGNYDYYLEKKEELTRIYAPAADAAAPEEAAAPSEASSTKLDWKAQKEEQARLRKKENELKKTEKRIEELETRDSEIDEEMSKPEVATNVAECVKLSKEKAEIAAELEELYEKWEELAE